MHAKYEYLCSPLTHGKLSSNLAQDGHISAMVIRRIFKSLVVSGLAVAAYAALAGGVGNAQGVSKQITVVELYTSLACSTCPPADLVLAEFAGRDDVLALSFHVDYWDYAGYADPYGNIAFTDRQERYLERFGINYMLTPQVFVDGKLEGIGNDRPSLESLIAEAAATRMNNVEVQLARTGEREMNITLPRMEYSGQAEVILIRYDVTHSTQVTGGDNDGKTLTNVNVVRQIIVHSLWKGDVISFDVPLERLGTNDLQFYAVIVQEPGQGAVLGASYIDLRKGA